MNLKHIVLLFILRVGFCYELSIKFDKLLNYLHKGLNFENDILFGSLLCISDINSIIHKNKSTPLTVYLESRQWKLVQYSKTPAALEMLNFYKSIIYSEFAKQDGSVGYGFQIGLLEYPLELISTDDYSDVVNTGKLTREVSDKCIAETMSTFSCVMSSNCLKILSESSDSFGYHKTHQVLLALMLLHRNCTSSIYFDQSIRTILSRHCEDILKENLLLYSKDRPSDVHDLFMEQILMCSLSGFSEFFNEITVSRVLSFQIEMGCFSLESDSKKCAGHATGLGAALFCRLAKIIHEFK